MAEGDFLWIDEPPEASAEDWAEVWSQIVELMPPGDAPSRPKTENLAFWGNEFDTTSRARGPVSGGLLNDHRASTRWLLASPV